MKSFIEQFPHQLEEAYTNAFKFEFNGNQKDFQNVVILGLGGSAFGGELIKNYCERTLPIPVIIVRDYTIPNFVSQNSLVIASSYSGNTEETLSAFQQSLEAGANIVCITSGGKLLDFAKNYRLSYIQLPLGYPPRAAAGFSFISKLSIINKLSLIPDFHKDFQESLQFLHSFSDWNNVYEMVEFFYGKIPVIYSSPSNESVAIRLRQQIQENSKQLCWHHVIPEMNHNELVGWELPLHLLTQTHVLIIRSSYDHQRIQYRMDFVKEKLQSKQVSVSELYLKGNNRMSQLLYGIHWSDWVSYYLAEKNQVDPSPVAVIDELKNSLAAK